MKSLFKPYLYGVVLFALMLSLLLLNTNDIELSITVLLILVIGISMDVVMIVYSTSKSVSLQGAITIFSAIVLNPTMAIITCCVSYMIELILIRSIRKEKLMGFDVRSLFNISMRLICITSAIYLYNLLPLYNIHTVIVILIITVIYTSTNMFLLFIMLGIVSEGATRFDRAAFNQNLMCAYLYTILVVIMYYGYKDYGDISIIVLFLFLIPVQTALLTGTVKKEIGVSLFKDALTGAYNRGRLNTDLTENITTNTDFTLLFLDLNRFKRINDTYGHDVGDNILIHFVNTVTTILRKDDRLYRFGGDEFVLLVDKKYEIEVIIKKLEKLKESLLFIHEDLSIEYSFSIGIYHKDDSTENISTVIENASKQMKLDKDIMHQIEDLKLKSS